MGGYDGHPGCEALHPADDVVGIDPEPCRAGELCESGHESELVSGGDDTAIDVSLDENGVATGDWCPVMSDRDSKRRGARSAVHTGEDDDGHGQLAT